MPLLAVFLLLISHLLHLIYQIFPFLSSKKAPAVQGLFALLSVLLSVLLLLFYIVVILYINISPEAVGGESFEVCCVYYLEAVSAY